MFRDVLQMTDFLHFDLLITPRDRTSLGFRFCSAFVLLPSSSPELSQRSMACVSCSSSSGLEVLYWPS